MIVLLAGAVACLVLWAVPAAAQQPSADVELTVSDGGRVIEPGDTLTYTAVVGNRGPDAATDVMLLHSVPADVNFLGAETTSGSCEEAGGILTCELGDLESGAAARVVIDVEVGELDGNSVESTFVVSTMSSDPDTENNTIDISSSAIEVLPLTGVMDQVLLPLAGASILAGGYLVFWSRRQRMSMALRGIR